MTLKDELMAWIASLSEEDQAMAWKLAAWARADGVRQATPRDVLDMD